MKTIKTVTIALAISGLVFTSCDKTNKEKAEDKIEAVGNDMEEMGDDISNEFKKMQVKLEDGTFVNYNMAAENDVTFDDWDGFNILRKEFRDFEELDFETSETRVENLRGSIMNLRNTIPAWLKNESVMEDIDDIEQEYREFMEDTDKSEDNMKENLEEISEKFDDLREEINETIENLKK